MKLFTIFVNILAIADLGIFMNQRINDGLYKAYIPFKKL